LVFGGTRDRDDLQFWSTLAGERDEPILTTNLHGRVASRTVRKVPVLPPPQMANLPAGQVMVIRRGIPPVVGRVQMAWRRRDVRAAAFARRHPAWAMCLTRWADAFRAWRQRVVLVVRAGLAGGYDRPAALLGRTAALLGALVGRIVSRVTIRLAGQTADAGGTAADVDTPTVEFAIPRASGEHDTTADAGARNGAPTGRWTR